MVTIAGTAVFGMASGATATSPPCPTATARYGDTVAGFVYSWGRSWRNMGDVWTIAHDNPGIANPSVLAVGDVVSDCPATRSSTAHVLVTTHGIGPGETLAALAGPSVGGWHWPIPVWQLAQANPGIANPFAALPVGSVVHLLATPPDYTPARPAAIIPRPIPFPLPTVPRQPVYPPQTTAPSTARAAPAPTYAPVVPVLPPSSRVPKPEATTIPALPPATDPPDPPKLVDPPIESTTPTDPPSTIKQSHAAAAAPPRVFGGETSSPVPIAPSPLVALADKIGGPDWHGPDPTVVAGYWRVFATAIPGLAPEGLSYLLGSIQQESDFNAASHNIKEGAWGIIQAEGGRCINVPHTSLAEAACVVNELTSPTFSGGPAHVDPGPVMANALDTDAAAVAAKKTVLSILSTPGLGQDQYRAAIKLYEGYGREGARTRYGEQIWHAVSK